jgi:N-methylhydantoinase A
VSAAARPTGTNGASAIGEPQITVGIDIGGTFTDVVVFVDGPDGASISWGKASSTPENAVEGVIAGVGKLLSRSSAGPADVAHVMHATTVGTNAILERTGARLGIVTTEGFEDVLEIGRQKRSQLYDVFLEPETPGFLCPRRQRLGIAERIAYDGTVLRALDEEQVRRAAAQLKDEGVEAVAVCYLFSFQNPVHELRTEEILREHGGGLSVSLSHLINPVFREYERLCVTAFDAYLRPVMERYLTNLVTSLAQLGFKGTVQTMKSRGGLASTRGAVRQPVTTLLSGPAAGVIGAHAVVREAGLDNVITLDMGGTSADIAVLRNGAPLVSTQGRIGRYPLSIPMVDVRTIGAGGGSIAWLDGANGLRVGPRSAGSDPGPACYGRGGSEPTVTDASLLLGYLDPDYFVAGERGLEADAAERAIARIAEPLGLSTAEAALGIHRIANAHMADAIRLAATKRGYDVREFDLMAFGGAGPVQAALLCDELGMGRCIVPRTAGVLSALGLLLSSVEYDGVQTFMATLDDFDCEQANRVLERLAEAGFDTLADDGYARAECAVAYSADMRYVGQSTELAVPLAFPLDRTRVDELARAFTDEHERVYGYAPPDTPVEIVNLRTFHSRPSTLPVVEALRDRTDGAPAAAARPAAHRECVFPDGAHRTPIFYRDALHSGFARPGPLVIEQDDTTIVVPPAHSCVVDRLGNVIVEGGPAG